MSDRGIALVITLLALALFSALGLGLLLATSSERLTAANHAQSVEASNAADAGIEIAARELALIADWNRVLDGTTRSRKTDGAAGGARTIGGFAFNLTTLTSQLTCNRTSTCTDTRINTSSADRPWGVNNARWQLFVYGRLRLFAPAAAPLPDDYIAVWIGDDARETDGNALLDTNGVVRAHAQAVAPGGTRRAIDAEFVRTGAGIRVQSWRNRPGVLP
jgi:hypothetical protein